MEKGLLSQFGSGALKFAGGGLAASTGIGLCSTVGGCFVGAPMAAIGGSGAVQGGTMMWNALHGRKSEGLNHFRDLALKADPRWGGFAYDAADTAVTAGSLFARTPLIVGKSIAGIDRAKSMFGATVPRMDNSTGFFGKVFDSNVTRGLLGASLLSKGYNAADSYPVRNDAKR